MAGNWMLGKPTEGATMRAAAPSIFKAPTGAVAFDLAQAIALYEGGKPLRDVGDVFGINHETVRQRLLAAGVTMRVASGLPGVTRTRYVGPSRYMTSQQIARGPNYTLDWRAAFIEAGNRADGYPQPVFLP